MPHIQAGNLNVHYIERGEGTPVLLVHGNWATSSWWEPVMQRLPSGLRGVAYDMRGRGQTEGPDNDYTIPEMAADLRAFSDALGLGKFHLVGHSLGSAVAMQFTLENPECVLTLTCVSPAWVDGMPAAYNVPAGQLAIKADRTLFAQVLKAQAPTLPEGDLWQRLVSESHEQRIEAALRNLPALMEWKPGDRLREIGVPVLVVSGQLDLLTGGANADRAAAALGAHHAVVPSVGHSPIVEAPDAFVSLLTEHLRQTPAGSKDGRNLVNDDTAQNEAREAIQERIDASIEADKRREQIDTMTPDFTLKLISGEVLDRQQLEQDKARDQSEIISISDATSVVIDDLILSGDEATVYTNQRFVRTVWGRDGKPHEVITNITHRELWVNTSKGWLQRHIEELEQGPTFVDGAPYEID